jgi:hypothetical protein
MSHTAAVFQARHQQQQPQGQLIVQLLMKGSWLAALGSMHPAVWEELKPSSNSTVAHGTRALLALVFGLSCDSAASQPTASLTAFLTATLPPLRCCFIWILPGQGPAVWALRAQTDKQEYAVTMRRILETTPNLSIREGMATGLDIGPNDEVLGVTTFFGLHFPAKAVVLTTGTFMNGRIWVGRASMAAGRAGEPAPALTANVQRCLHGIMCLILFHRRGGALHRADRGPGGAGV